MLRRTKIIATLGPATDAHGALEQILAAGVDVVRVNFSHGSAEDHRRRVSAVRNWAEANDHAVGVLVDLQGPKIRIDRFQDSRINLCEGDRFVLDADLDSQSGTAERVGVAYKGLADDLSVGDTLLLDDGCIVLKVEKIHGRAVYTRVEVGGELSNNKGINRQGGGLSAKALTDKDKKDIELAAELEADYLALSFPRSAADVVEARTLLTQAGCTAGIIAKIERAEAVDQAREITLAADGIMVARGDLGVELGDAELPAVQKQLIQMARSLDRVVITATQMMQSMVASPIPTRAEVFDVANAVLDGTDAVMLSAETATGKYPVKTVAAMERICLSAERQSQSRVSKHRVDRTFARIDEGVAMATMYTANHLGVKAIAALTESGDTPLWMSRMRSGIPIYALTPHLATRRKVTLYRGVYPATLMLKKKKHTKANRAAIAELIRQGAVSDGDLVIITKGDLMGKHGGTNALKIVRVGDPDLKI